MPFCLTLLLLLLALPLPAAADGDRGIYPDLDPQVVLHVPTWTAPLAATGPDCDRDGVPDGVDLLRGAKKTVLANAPYGSPYRTLAYPGGDVPREEGVCTDVVIRALRNAGFDLQKLLHDDIRLQPSAYPMVRKANPHIDHRRVKTLLPYFRRHWDLRQGTLPDTLADWRPGDVVFMDTLSKPGPDHIGILSDRLGKSGLPLVTNSWTDGYRTSEMDLLGSVPVTHRFRLREGPADPHGIDPEALLQGHGLTLPKWARQVVLVTAPGWQSDAGTLRRLERTARGWRQAGEAAPVRLGHAGLGWGRGLHGAPVPRAGQGGPTKQEGDGRSPAGVFALGVAFGKERVAASRWPLRKAGPRDRWVDDPKAATYNTWQVQPAAQKPPWRSAEVLARPDGQYDLALVVQHNTQPVQPGAGSAIFLHLPGTGPTVGCTSLARPGLESLLRWLDPDKRVVLVQVPQTGTSAPCGQPIRGHGRGAEVGRPAESPANAASTGNPHPRRFAAPPLPLKRLLQKLDSVTPAEAGAQAKCVNGLGSRLRGNDVWDSKQPFFNSL